MLQHQHTFLFDKLKKNFFLILIEDYSFNQRHKIIVSNGIIILSVSKIKWVAENEIVVKCQKSPIFFLSNFPQCDNNQATSKFESHVPSIIKKKKKERVTFLSISTTYHRESFKFTEMTGIKLYLLTQFPN